MEQKLDLKKILGYHREKGCTFSEFVAQLIESPLPYLHTSATLIHEAIKHFGYRIVVRSGEPTISYNIFEDPFSGGISAVYGQEFCISELVDKIKAIGKESGTNRGIVLVGPPASGKTNIIDLISMAVEVYTKQEDVKLYSFYYEFKSKRNNKVLEVRPPFFHNPVLLFPTILKRDGKIIHPRQELFDYLNSQRKRKEKIPIPTYYQNANLDKMNLDILNDLLESPRNAGKSLFDILEEYIRIEKIEFASAQARGLANIDDMGDLFVQIKPVSLNDEYREILSEHLPGKSLYRYEGGIVSANRGILHIHDAFGINEGSAPNERDYKPLLMLLGSGKSSIESTQTSIDTTVVLTTNIEEMKILDRQLTSSKFLDRIDKIPVNYLLDAASEMEILHRDIRNMREKYDIDPNLLKIAAYFSVMTRLLPPLLEKFPPTWSQEKQDLYRAITPEQKLFIYSSQAEDPVTTIQKLPLYHPFYNEALKLGIDIYSPKTYKHLVQIQRGGIFLDKTGLFSNEQLKHIDDDFMRVLWNEHQIEEGKHGISVRQLQNIMRDTIARSDGRSVNVGLFFSQLERTFQEGPSLHHWLTIDPKYKDKYKPVPARKLGSATLQEGEGDYGDFKGLANVAKYLYWFIISREIIVSTVDRDPDEIAQDLRKYLQHTLLANAIENKAFSHILVPRYSFIDPASGNKVDKPDLNFMQSLENVLVREKDSKSFRNSIAHKFLDFWESGDIKLEEGKSIITSRNDNVLGCFGNEYATLLSHRKTVEGINPEYLRDAFFHKKNYPARYKNYNAEVKEFVDIILYNMVKRFNYSYQIALGTIIYALHKNIVNFSKIIC